MTIKTQAWIAAVGAALLLASAANADHRRHSGGEYYAYAKVIDVRPIVRVVEVSTPTERCWNQPVTRAYHRHGYRSKTPVLVGGILGGVVGNQFGRGRGNDIMTVAGALLGASIARDAAHHQNPAHVTRSTYSTTERHCEVQHVVHQEEQIDGYDVRYRYQGRTFATRMPYDPGRRVKIKVNVASAGY